MGGLLADSRVGGGEGRPERGIRRTSALRGDVFDDPCLHGSGLGRSAEEMDVCGAASRGGLAAVNLKNPALLEVTDKRATDFFDAHAEQQAHRDHRPRLAPLRLA